MLHDFSDRRYPPVTCINISLVVAYFLGYTATTTPRIAAICARYVAKGLKQRKVESPKNGEAIASERELLRRLGITIKGGFRTDGFAMACGTRTREARLTSYHPRREKVPGADIKTIATTRVPRINYLGVIISRRYCGDVFLAC